MTSEQISNLYFDLVDIRNVLSERILKSPKDNEGTELTIGDLLDDAIETLKTAQEAA